MCAAFLIPRVITDQIKRLEVLLPISLLKIINYKKPKHKTFQSLIFFARGEKRKPFFDDAYLDACAKTILPLTSTTYINLE